MNILDENIMLTEFWDVLELLGESQRQHAVLLPTVLRSEAGRHVNQR